MQAIRLVVIEGPDEATEFTVADGAVIGRGQEADVWLSDDSISRRHASVSVEGRTLVIEDVGSRNGTLVNGERIDSPCRLADGDAIALGDTVLEVRVVEMPTPPPQAPVTPTVEHRPDE